ncbi:MAG: hypothetical protein ACLGG7_00945 [Bacteriovoracia bacterium]
MRALVPMAVFLSMASAQAARWDKTNDPNKLKKVTGVSIVADFAKLPLAAKLTNVHLGWSDTFWPSNRGGIAYRWNAEPNPENFKYRFLTKEEVSTMTSAELERLSPAEKFDIYNGQYGYPFTRKVMKKYTPKDAWWEGICHGWAAAAISHIEPQRVDLKNKDGVVVPFGSTDVKGLLSFYYAEVHETKVYTRLSDRCKARGKVPGEAYDEDRIQTPPPARDANKLECQGVNPGSFHLALTNIIGLQDRGFVADVDRFADVWNQPIVGFNVEVLGEVTPTPAQAAIGAVKVLKVKTEMTYGDESYMLDPEGITADGGHLSMNPVSGTPEQNYLSRFYEYLLEIDASGAIIGGTWLSEGRPDFIWMKGAAPKFTGGKGFNMSTLNEIYRPVID